MAIFSAVIPKYHKEFASGSDQAILADAPTNANKVVAIRINGVSGGTSCSLRLSGATVVHDNCANGEIIVGEFDQMTNANTDVDSIIVYYV